MLYKPREQAGSFSKERNASDKVIFKEGLLINIPEEQSPASEILQPVKKQSGSLRGLYPDFNELAAFKDRKSKLVHPSSRSVRSSLAGNHHSPFRGQGLEFDSVRQYVLGDDIRTIDWRVTARTGSPHVKIFKEERERHVVICVDMNASMRFGTKNTFKSVQAARAAAWLGWKGIAGNDRVSCCLFGDVQGGMQIFPPKKTGRAFSAVLKMLSAPLSESHFFSLGDAMSHLNQAAHTGSLVYVISDFLDIDPHFQQGIGISRLNKRCEMVFIAINDQADRVMPPLGVLGFSADGMKKILANTDSIAGREAYAAQWLENRKVLYEAAARLKIPLLEMSTASNVHLELMTGLKHLARRKRR
ncbi:MAG: DUF58 domain-containing protein [Candidatus Protochlamydia sp.]|nr:DUF58 domain-containing protein [Candidatus Protochlamydia sp.]